MPQINLLPWREELRKRRQKEFGVMALVAIVLMGGVVAAVHLHFQGLIDFQNERNQYLTVEIGKLNKQIAEIKDLQREKERLLARTEKIQQLQSGRPDIVHLVDQLVKTLPEGVFLTRIEQKGVNLRVDGVAQSNARVSSLMRQLDASDWLENPALVEIKRDAAGSGGGDESIRNAIFTLTIQQTIKRKSGASESGGSS